MLGFELDFWDYVTFAALFVVGVVFLGVLIFLLGLPGRIASEDAPSQFFIRQGAFDLHGGAPCSHPSDLKNAGSGSECDAPRLSTGPSIRALRGRTGGVARPCGVDRRLRDGVSRYASTNPRYFDNALSSIVLPSPALMPAFDPKLSSRGAV